MALNRVTPPLIPGVKLLSYRPDDGKDQLDLSYIAARGSVVERDGNNCQFCGVSPSGDKKAPSDSLKFSGYLEVHHIDDDHNHNDSHNLITACHACHQVFHVGFAAMRRSGRLVLLPQISQEELNLLCHAIGVGLYSVASSEELKKELNATFNWLLSFEQAALDVFNVGDLALFSTLLGMVAHRNRTRYDEREKWLSSIRVLPEISKFETIYRWWGTHGWAGTDSWENIYLDLNLNNHHDD